ncbi:MAG: GTPase, partial [Alphaproteobacteria bacterium]
MSGTDPAGGAARERPFTVAIVGRPNVGKSTLFNRLTGRRLALVDDTPGLTRDRREGRGKLGTLRFRVFDTAGFEDAEGRSLEARMRRQTEAAAKEADLVLLVIDAREGVTSLDREFARVLRRIGCRVLLLANKCEGKAGIPGLAEGHGLGFGDPVPVSAEHAEGFAGLQEAIRAAMPKAAHDADEPVLPV